jgi:hypothetical protein
MGWNHHARTAKGLLGMLVVALTLVVPERSPVAGQSPTLQPEPTRATGLITFMSGYRDDITEPVFGPYWEWMQGTAVMRVRLERRGSDWVDAGSTYSLIAIDEEGPYTDPDFCHHSVTRGGVRRRPGPLIINNGDGISLRIDRASGSAELWVSGFSAPGIPESAGEDGPRCEEPGPWRRTNPPDAGWAVLASCAEGRLDGTGTVIHFDRQDCTSGETFRHGIAVMFQARSLEGQITLLP